MTLAECVSLMFLPQFNVVCDVSLNRRTATWNLYVVYHKETNYGTKGIYVICCLYKMKQSHWLLCVSVNCDWSRKMTRLSNLTRASLLMELKPTVKAELNCEIYPALKKTLEKSSQFSSSEQPCEPKTLDVVLIITEV